MSIMPLSVTSMLSRMAFGFVVIVQNIAQHELRHTDIGQRAFQIVRDDAGEVLLHFLGGFQLRDRLFLRSSAACLSAICVLTRARTISASSGLVM